ncbi:MAG: hypothetical protein K9M98_08230 [Cephaloticoccus sp.]|nr:hypothetical protein [Cephaloticoccus sp.]MCF7760476.1 hypothetical protein [Cephaloticoccus sp.]
MRLRILLFLTLLGTVAFGGAYFFSYRENQSLQIALDVGGRKIQQQQATITSLETAQARDQAQLLAMDATLGATKTRLTAAESEQVVLRREIRDLRNQLQESATHNTLLTKENERLGSALSAARSNRASLESVREYQETIAKLEQALANAQAAQLTPPTAPALVQTQGVVLTTNRGRNSTVVSVGPADAFVVVNYGATHGAMPTQQLSIMRGTEILATALISDVRENYSIAQIQPQSLRGALHKGDSAVLAQ